MVFLYTYADRKHEKDDGAKWHVSNQDAYLCENCAHRTCTF